MRCSKCNKRIIMNYECKCKQNFCLNCLPFYTHNCTYDYKKEKKDMLQENNPKIIAIKVANL